MAIKFKKHMMYDPKTGEGYMANTHEDHVRMDKKGYVHKKPKPPFAQTGFDISKGYGGNVTSGTDKWFKQSFESSGGGQYGNPGPGNTGYSIDWSEIDFGKAALEQQMNKSEGATNEQICARKGGVWNAEKGICEKKEKQETKKEELIDCGCGDGIQAKTEKECEEKCKELDTGDTTKPCECDGEVVARVPVGQDCPECPGDDPVPPPPPGPTPPTPPGGDEFDEEELTSDVYNVKQSTKFSLLNLFKEGKLRKSKYEHSEDVRKRMRADYISASSERYKLLTTKNRQGNLDSSQQKRLNELEEIIEKNNPINQNKKLIKVTLPNGEKKEMTISEFEENYADKLNLKDKLGGEYDDYAGRAGRDYYGQNVPTQFKSQFDYTRSIPFQFKSPFPRRQRGYLKLRENWMPTQTPMNYGSPLHQDINNQQFGSIWEKIQAYGTDMDKKIDKFIKHNSYNPESDKPINSFENKQWVGIITKWLQDKKAKIIEAKNSKDNDTQQQIDTAVNTLIQDVTTYSGKFMDWIERNAGDAADGNAGGSVVSQGSKKDEKFIGNITFMGDKNTTIAIGDDGKIGIKSFGLPSVKYVEELDNDVFAKDDVGYSQFIKISEQLQKEAEAGKPLNEDVIKGSADNLLKNEDSILSWAFDPLYGQSWLQDYAQGNPDLDLDVFMPESPKFDIDLLTDELHGWLTSKLKDSYDKNVPQQPEQKGDTAQNIMNQTLSNVEQEKQNKQGVYAEGNKQQAPPQQGQIMAQAPPPPPPPSEENSPMSYKDARKKRALELIRKFS